MKTEEISIVRITMALQIMLALGLWAVVYLVRL